MVAFLSCAVAIILLIIKLRTHPTPEALYVNQQNHKQTGEEN